jgi:zinc finger protein MSN2/4
MLCYAETGVVVNGPAVANTLDSTRPTIGESIGHSINHTLGQSLDHQMGYIDEQMDRQIDQYVTESLEGGALAPENGLTQSSNTTDPSANVANGPNSANGAPGVDNGVEPTINPRQLFSRLPQSVSSPALSTLFGSKRYTSVPKLPDQSKAQFEVNDKVNLKMNDVNNWYGINMNWAIDENKPKGNNSFGVNYDMNDIPLSDQMIISDNNLNDLGISPTIKMPLPTIKQGRSQSLSSPVMSHMNALLRRNSIATPDILKKKRRKSNDLSALNTNLSPVNHHIRSRGNSVASISKSSGASSSTKDNMSISASAALNNQLSPVNSSYNQPHQQDGSSSGSGSSSNQYPPVTSFPCTECDKQFKRSEHLKRHIRSVHSNIRPFHCKYCEKKFSRSDNLAQHLKTHYRTDANGNPTIVYGNPNNQRKSKK